MAVTRSKRQSDTPSEPSETPNKKPRQQQTETPAAENTQPKPVQASAAAASAVTEQKPRHSHHLIKSEPESRLQNGHEMKFSINDLMKEPNATAHWDGVRNYEARNCMKNMKRSDLAFFYHSNTKKSKPGIVGIVEVVKEAYPDHTAEDPHDPHYDPKHTAQDPRWFMVDVKLIRRFNKTVTLDDVKANPQLADMQLVKRGRISVQDVTDQEWTTILKMAEQHES